MSDNNEERREDRNRKMSLEEDKSKLEEKDWFIWKIFSKYRDWIKTNKRRDNPYHKEQSSRVSKVTNGDGKV